jgi:hypothetical protein
MKTFFYLWCFMAAVGLIASFFNPGHLYFTCLPSVMMAAVSYPETKEDNEDSLNKRRSL